MNNRSPQPVVELTDKEIRDFLKEGIVDEYLVCKVQMTPELAGLLLEKNTNNRPIRMSRVTEMMKAIENGDWVLTPQAAAIRTDGTLGDGQHRILAVLKSGRTVPMFLWFGMPEEVVTVLDTGTKRSATDVFSLRGIDKASILSSAARTLWRLRNDQWGNKGGSGTNKEVIQAFEAEVELADHVEEGKIVGRGIGIGAGLATTLVYLTRRADLAGAVQDFDVDVWLSQVTHGELLTRKDPAYLLRQTIQGWKDRNLRVTPRMQFGVYAKAFSASVNGDKIIQLRFQERDTIPDIEHPVRARKR